MTAELRSRAIALLARREHSRIEIERKLAKLGDAAALAATLDALEGDGYLSDRRFAESFVASRCERYGPARLRSELRLRGVADELVIEALGAAPDEAEAARAAWSQRYECLPQDAREFARQARFLQARGFAGDVVRRLLSGRER